jgi:hypothetical protein
MRVPPRVLRVLDKERTMKQAMASGALLVAGAACAASAFGQPVVRGIRGNGDVIRISPQTGAGAFITNCGVACDGAAGYVWYAGRAGRSELLLIGGGTGATADQITALGDWTGAVVQAFPTVGRPAGASIRALAWNGDFLEVYVLLGLEGPGAERSLARIDLQTGQYTLIGATGRADLEAIAFSPGHVLYGLGTDGGGTLCTIDAGSGWATPIGGGGFGGDDLSLAFLPDGGLLACGSNLRLVDAQTGAASLIGPTGYSDIRGLTVVDVCYPNCSPFGPPPPLNVNDFLCFQSRFAAGDPYANCDQSTTPPVLSVNDYLCFMRTFVAAGQDCF